MSRCSRLKRDRMPTISRGHTPLTLINVFTVSPEKQDELIALLSDVTQQNVRHHKGFISASLHRGIDGNKVTIYAQWASTEDYQSMRQNSGPAPRTGTGAQIGDVRSGNVR